VAAIIGMAGYYFCRPVPADDFVRYVQLRSSSPGSAIALA